MSEVQNTVTENLLTKEELLKKALEHYELLDEDQKKIIETKDFREVKPIQEWLDKFENLVAYDFWADEYLKHYPKKFSGGFSGFFYIFYYFIYLIWGIAFMAAFNVHIFVIVLLGLLPIIYWGINRYIKHKRKIPQLRKQDLPNYFRDFVVPLLRIFKDESSPNFPVFLRLNMITPLTKRLFRTETGHLLISEREHYNASKNTKFYEYPIVELKAKLMNKVFIDLDVKYIVRERYRYRRKGNKYKLRARAVYLLKMKVPKANFKLKNLEQQTPAFMEMMETEARYIFKLKMQQESYSTRMATKGNKSSEYFNLEESLFNQNIPQIPVILQMAKEVYNRLQEVEV